MSEEAQETLASKRNQTLGMEEEVENNDDNPSGKSSSLGVTGGNNRRNKRTSSNVDDSIESSSSDSSGKSGSGRGYNADYSGSDDQFSDDFSGDQQHQHLQELGQVVKQYSSGDRENRMRLPTNGDEKKLDINDDDSSDNIVRRSRRRHNNRSHNHKRFSVDTPQIDDTGQDTLNFFPPAKIAYDVNSLSELWCNAASAAVVAAGSGDLKTLNNTLLSLGNPNTGCNSATTSINQPSSSSLIAQWNGIHISNPMDPRIDFGSLSQVQPFNTCSQQQQYQDSQTAQAQSLPAGDDRTDLNGNDPQQPQSTHPLVDPRIIVDSYMRLMEAVRPYFNAHGVALASPGSQELNSLDNTSNIQNQETSVSGEREYTEKQHHGSTTSSDNNLSSEGFTAFFTTTDSNSSRNDGSEDSSLKRKERLESSFSQESKYDATQAGDKSDGGSSMVVLARPKRKHQANPPSSSGDEQSTSTTNTSDGRRVRIQEAAHNRLQLQHELREHNVQQQQILLENQALELQERQHEAQHILHLNEHEERRHPPTRLVTDVSSSNRTDSGVSNTASSGSGSAGNTGSGSNRGSSGSGNDGKNSSEELAKEDNSGDGTNEGSDGSANDRKQPVPKLGIGLAPGGPHHRHSTGSQEHDRRASTMGGETAESPNQQPTEKWFNVTDTNDVSTRERKLQDKKRKRIEMRREYEAQQHLESSESSEVTDKFFRPGRPVTLDQVMVFCMIPRIVLQSVPPFLIIHTNAAFCRLTGIDSHLVVGKPIGYMLSLPTNSQAIEASEPSPNDWSTTNHRPTISNSATEIGLERLVASSGFGQYQVLNVRTKQLPLGGNVTFMNKFESTVDTAVAQRKRNEDFGASTSLDVQYAYLPCRVAIAPIVSTNTFGSFERKKHTNGVDYMSSKRNHATPLVTHYVIQLQSMVDETFGKTGSVGSLSTNSNSAQAYLMGLSNSDIQRQRVAAGIHFPEIPPHIGSPIQSLSEDGSTAASSATKQPVTAVG